MEDKECPKGDAGKADAVVPLEGITEMGDGEYGEDRERNDFLNGFELGAGKFVAAKAIRGYLEAVFEESDAPTGEASTKGNCDTSFSPFPTLYDLRLVRPPQVMVRKICLQQVTTR